VKSHILHIKQGRVIDPANGMDEVKDIFVTNGKITSNLHEAPDMEINASGLWVVPGLIDMHVHLRDPGQLHKETLQSGAAAAAAGGFATVCCMPNTSPVIDNVATINYIRATASKITVLPIGSISVGLEGKEISPMREMKEAGICAISDDGKTLADSVLFKEAMRQAKELDLPILVHCEEEVEIIERDISLARQTGAKLHICHVSTARGVELIRAAQKAGLDVTAEAAPHHFTLTQDDHERDPNFKMSPPLRTAADRAAIIEGLRDGTIGVIATDHAPHSEAEKAVDYELAPNGIIGLETALAIAYTELVCVHKILTPSELIKKFTVNPAEILGLDTGHLGVGAAANITIINPNEAYAINKNTFKSLSRNTPFHGREVVGQVVCTIANGKIV